MPYPITINKITQSRIHELDFENIEFGKIFSDHLFIANYKDSQWQDCRIVPYDNISLSPATSCIHYGQSIFEGMKTFKNSESNPLLFRPEMNARRLNRSAQRMAMAEVPEELFINALHELIALDQDWIPTTEGSSLYIRPYLFATDEYIGMKASDTYKFIIFTCPVSDYYSQPVNVLVTDKYIRAFEGGTGTAKAAGNYAATMLPVKEARAKGYDQILWLDGKEFKYIQEIGTMNIFFIINNVVVTPELDETLLDGITRDSVIQLCKDKGIKVEERKVTIQEIYAAFKNKTLQDCFGTGTAATIAQIAKIGYKGENLILPPGDQRAISNELRKELYDIKTGKLPDKFNWMVKVKAAKSLIVNR
ncbi:MAG: branched-chain amino acid aminotransferase [Bacteroidetes bacterium]|nr:branched-chain amino acid aminotransferase [Bacteroidota bacterium]